MENGRYKVDYGTGAGNSYHDTVEEAQEAARAGMTYTQQSVKIIDTDTDEQVSISKWWSVAPGDDADVLCQIGSYGYYSGWQD